MKHTPTGKQWFILAHQLHWAKIAHGIIVMQNGEVVEQEPKF